MPTTEGEHARELSYSRWKASTVRTRSILERSSKISFDKWWLYHALDRSSREKKNTWMEKREDFLAIAVLKRGQGEKKHALISFHWPCLRSFRLLSVNRHTHSKHNTHVISATERAFATTHHTEVCLYETPRWNCPLLLKSKLWAVLSFPEGIFEGECNEIISNIQQDFTSIIHIFKT